jgi:hypothetical protein
MTEEEKIIAEKQEINLLIDKGVNISVDRTIYVRHHGFIKRFWKKVKRIETVKFTIHEPTLSTLDRITAEQIDLRIDESLLKESAMQEAKMLVSKHGRRLARIIALAVIGQDYVISIQESGRIVHKNDDKRLDELTELFFMNLKPSQLVQYCILINTMSNIGDFISSIRLMSAARTTMPNLIEEKQKA